MDEKDIDKAFFGMGYLMGALMKYVADDREIEDDKQRIITHFNNVQYLLNEGANALRILTRQQPLGNKGAYFLDQQAIQSRGIVRDDEC